MCEAKCYMGYRPRSITSLFIFSLINDTEYIPENFMVKEYSSGFRKALEALMDKYDTDIDGLYKLSVENQLLDYENIVFMSILPKRVFTVQNVDKVISAYEEFGKEYCHIRLSNIIHSLRGFRTTDKRVRFLCLNSYGKTIWDKNDDGLLTGKDFIKVPNL